MANTIFTTDNGGERTIELVINGVTSQVEVESGTRLADFVTEKAREAGIRTFSVYVDGSQANTEQGRQDISTARKVEIVTKDSRGLAA